MHACEEPRQRGGRVALPAAHRGAADAGSRRRLRGSLPSMNAISLEGVTPRYRVPSERIQSFGEYADPRDLERRWSFSTRSRCRTWRFST